MSFWRFHVIKIQIFGSPIVRNICVELKMLVYCRAYFHAMKILSSAGTLLGRFWKISEKDIRHEIKEQTGATLKLIFHTNSIFLQSLFARQSFVKSPM